MSRAAWPDLRLGASSLDVEIRVYAATREWNDFYAVREDVLFRIKEIVERSGTSMAFPSQTLYMSRDTGVDVEKGSEAIREVGRWRQRREYPFPRFSAALRKRIDDTIVYPPPGSPDHAGKETEASTGDESLSAQPVGGEDAREKSDEGESKENDQPREKRD